MAKVLPSPSPTATNPFGRSPRHRKPGGKAAIRAGWDWLRGLVSAWLHAPNWGRVALVVMTTLILSSLLSLHLLPDKVALRVGDVSPQDVRAPHTIQYVDWAETRALRDVAAAQVDPVYSPERYASRDAEQAINETYARLAREQMLANHNARRVATELRQEIGLSISSPDAIAPLLNDNGAHLAQARRQTSLAVHEAMEREIRDDRPDDMRQARAAVTARIADGLLPRALVPGVLAVAQAVLRPNRHGEAGQTQRAREAAMRAVPPQHSEVLAGDIVVRRGQIVTGDMIDKLRALGLQNPRLDWGMAAAVTLLTALMVAVVGFHLGRFHRPVYNSTKTLVLLSDLVILSVFSLKLSGTALGVQLSGAQFGYIGMLCVAASGMLIAALINPRVAMLVTALMAAQSGLILGNDLRFAVMTLLSGFVAIFAVSDLRSRNDVVRAGAALCVCNILLSLIIGRIEGDSWQELSRSMIWAFSSGVFAVALFWLAAPLLERIFGITTHLGLLELSDPNRSLLKRFCEAAPGTYTHSVMVGNLAVSAAEAIGADALLCRVGAYYHDLGKMRLPEYFVENQHGGDNVHDRLNPSLSAIAVTAHVKYGLDIAEQEHLPSAIKAFITEHHGTSLIKYFYHQQRSGDPLGSAPGLEQHFRYAGPKPQSRETAILMLADSVEAASRTLEKPTLGRIEDLIDKIFAAQLSDGQLDECDLTLRDLRGIRSAFVRLLSGMLHTRIHYPDLLKTDGNPAHASASP